MSAEQRPTIDLDKKSKKIRKRVLGGAVAFTALAAVGSIGYCAGKDNSESTSSVAPRTETSQTVTEAPTVSPSFPSFPPLSEAASMEPSVDVSTAPSFDSEQAPSSVLDVASKVGVFTYTGGIQRDVPYASGVVISSTEILTTAGMFGSKPKDSTVKCGHYDDKDFSYTVKTSSGEHRVTSVKRDADSNVDLAVATVADPFFETPVTIASEVDASGMVYDVTSRVVLDGTGGTPDTTNQIVGGELPAQVNASSNAIEKPFYGSKKWDVVFVGTPKGFAYDQQTGAKDSTRESIVGNLGNGGPVVDQNGGVLAIQSSASIVQGEDQGFFATPVTQTQIDAIQAAPDTTAQKC